MFRFYRPSHLYMAARTMFVSKLDDTIFEARLDEARNVLFMDRTSIDRRESDEDGKLYDQIAADWLEMALTEFEYVGVLQRIEHLGMKKVAYVANNPSGLLDAAIVRISDEIRGLLADERRLRAGVVAFGYPDTDLRRAHCPSEFRYAP